MDFFLPERDAFFVVVIVCRVTTDVKTDVKFSCNVVEWKKSSPFKKFSMFVRLEMFRFMRAASTFVSKVDGVKPVRSSRRCICPTTSLILENSLASEVVK